MIFFNFVENIEGISLVFINVVTPVFALVLIGYIIGVKLSIDAQVRFQGQHISFLYQPLFLIFSAKLK